MRAMPPRAVKNNQDKMKNQTNIKIGITQILKIKKVFPDDSDVETLFHKLARESQEKHYDELGLNESNRHEETKEETSKRKFSECKICSNKKISPDNKSTHDLVHANSSFISDLMSKYFRKCNNDTDICCSKCNRSTVFNKMQTLKHLTLQHKDVFKGREKEILKQIGFFAIVKTKQPQLFDDVIKIFEFSNEQMLEFLKLYFSNEKKDQIQRDLLLGKMFLQLKDILGKIHEAEIIKGIIRDLIPDYQKALKKEKEKVIPPISQANKTQSDVESEESSCSSELPYKGKTKKPSDKYNQQNKRSANNDISKHDRLRKKVKNRTEVLQQEDEYPLSDSSMADIEKPKNQDIESDRESDSGVSVAGSISSYSKLTPARKSKTLQRTLFKLTIKNSILEDMVRSLKEELKKKL